MSSNAFTVTTVDYVFTATVSNPAALTLSSNPDDVSVTNTVNTVTVRRVNQPVIVQITGAGGVGNPFNQILNTNSDVEFESITVHEIYGKSPVNFVTGINVGSVGSEFVGPVDFTSIAVTITNQLALLYAFTPVNFGSITEASPHTINFGSI